MVPNQAEASMDVEDYVPDANEMTMIRSCRFWGG